MIRKLLIANRGEVVLRIIRTCEKLGIIPVTVFSPIDAEYPHARAGREAYLLSRTGPLDPYLDGKQIIELARRASVDAIHPGYGFLAENADFADAVRAAGIIFVGPEGDAMRALGEKHRARKVASAAGVPVIPGYDGDEQELDSLNRRAMELGFPLMVKASAGGGGRGMRLVENGTELSHALTSAKREATAAFGNDHLILERVIRPARHIEVQLIGDSFGNVLHCYERDCSMQRRQQKVIEETPAPNLTATLRDQICDAAVRVARQAKLSNATTIEFLVPVQEKKSKGAGAPPFYFLEANCRLQVEHPITELVTGQDLVELQLRVAAGERLALRQEEITITGSAMEARVYGEHPGRNFAPASGRIHELSLPTSPTTRIDHTLTRGLELHSQYDSMLAKVACFGSTREDARARLTSALGDTLLLGVETNIPYLLAILEHEAFVAANVTTSLLAEHHQALVTTADFSELAHVALLGAMFGAPRGLGADIQDPFQSLRFFRLANHQHAGCLSLSGVTRHFTVRSDSLGANIDLSASVQSVQLNQTRSSPRELVVELDGRMVNVACIEPSESKPFTLSLAIDGCRHELSLLRETRSGQSFIIVHGKTFIVDERRAGGEQTQVGLESSSVVISPLPGRVVTVRVKPGQIVAAGESLVIIESMKMEHSLTAVTKGRVKEVFGHEGKTVRQGEVLLRLEPDTT